MEKEPKKRVNNKKVAVSENVVSPIEPLAPIENKLELIPEVVSFILSQNEKINAEIAVETDRPEYKNLVEQRNKSLERLRTLKQAIVGAENDFLKADSALNAADSQINMAKTGASKLQVGFLRGLVVASGVSGNELGGVSLVVEQEKHYIKYDIKPQPKA